MSKKYNGFKMEFYIENLELLLALNEDELANYQEAKENPKWVKVMKVEINLIGRNKTWRLVPRPRDTTVIGLKWVFKVKRDADGSISKYKARIVAKGYLQQQGIDFEEVFARVA